MQNRMFIWLVFLLPMLIGCGNEMDCREGFTVKSYKFSEPVMQATLLEKLEEENVRYRLIADGMVDVDEADMCSLGATVSAVQNIYSSNFSMKVPISDDSREIESALKERGVQYKSVALSNEILYLFDSVEEMEKAQRVILKVRKKM